VLLSLEVKEESSEWASFWSVPSVGRALAGGGDVKAGPSTLESPRLSVSTSISVSTSSAFCEPTTPGFGGFLSPSSWCDSSSSCEEEQLDPPLEPLLDVDDDELLVEDELELTEESSPSLSDSSLPGAADNEVGGGLLLALGFPVSFVSSVTKQCFVLVGLFCTTSMLSSRARSFSVACSAILGSLNAWELADDEDCAEEVE
jgi:hypothetical protein